MRILLHTCCAPCLVVPLDDLRAEGHDVTSFFYNPNIHPYSEFMRRKDALDSYVLSENVRLILGPQSEEMEEWFRQVAFREDQRCVVCFHLRMQKTAITAMEKGFDAFSTTLFYSRFQKHELLKEVCDSLSAQLGISFVYRDWRPKWNEGVKRYRSSGLYRQKYCGCIYSEKERVSKIVS